MPDKLLISGLKAEKERLENALKDALEAISKIADIESDLNGIPPKSEKEMPGYVQYVKEVMEDAEKRGEEPLTWEQILIRAIPSIQKNRDRYTPHQINLSKSLAKKHGTIIEDEAGRILPGPKFRRKNLLR